MKKTIALLPTILLLAACTGPLTKQKAESILQKAYAGSYNPDEAGGSRTIISGISIDSIHQAGDTARVFYRVSGTIENGSAFQKDADEGPLEDQFTKGIFGWKEK